MFQELMPLLSQRVLILTLSRVTDEELCVNVIPKPLKSDQQNDGTALTTPLAITGTPQELDELLPRQLVEFVDTHLGLSSTLKSAKEEMDAAAKAARESVKESTSKSNNGTSKRTSTRSAQVLTATESSAELLTANDAIQGPEADPAGLGTTTGSLFDVEVKADH
jgi:PRTRC genetic system protein E